MLFQSLHPQLREHISAEAFIYYFVGLKIGKASLFCICLWRRAKCFTDGEEMQQNGEMNCGQIETYWNPPQFPCVCEKDSVKPFEGEAACYLINGLMYCHLVVTLHFG